MSISPLSTVLASNPFPPTTNLQKAGSSQQTEFQRLAQELQSGLASTGQVPNGQDIFSGQQGSAAATISRPAHHHHPHNHGGAGSLLTSGFPGKTNYSGGGSAVGAENLLNLLNVSA
jgi:hypothetical protein